MNFRRAAIIARGGAGLKIQCARRQRGIGIVGYAALPGILMVLSIESVSSEVADDNRVVVNDGFISRRKTIERLLPYDGAP